jgi:hypothetical protein
MEGRVDVLTIIIAVGAAGFVAVTLGCVAHYDFGFSREQIRSDAVLAAILIAAMVAIDFFGKKLGKPK